jgi:heme A synthase
MQSEINWRKVYLFILVWLFIQIGIFQVLSNLNISF